MFGADCEMKNQYSSTGHYIQMRINPNVPGSADPKQ
jgi:hypothetical protein